MPKSKGHSKISSITDHDSSAPDLSETTNSVRSALVTAHLPYLSVDTPYDELAAENSTLHSVIASMPLGFCMYDKSDCLQLCNQKYLDVWKIPQHLGRRGTSYKDIMDASKGKEIFTSSTQPSLINGQRRREFITESGRRIEVLVHKLPDGVVVALHEDVTARRQSEAKVEYLASHDTLTDLANRATLQESLTDCLNDNQSREFALLYLDLDAFKQVNDTMGHQAGDLLLTMVAKRIRNCCAKTDLIARLGGDEFAIVAKRIKHPNHAQKIAQRIIQKLSDPFDLEGTVHHIGVSIGIAVAPIDATEPDELSRKADMALYQAKSDGRGIYRFYNSELDRKEQERRLFITDLRRAINNEEFELHYQAQYNFDSMQICGAEALLRWNHPVRGLVPPDQFIPIAEETGLIIDIGRWVIRSAAAQAGKWPESIRVALNVSAVQFRDYSLLDNVRQSLIDFDLPPERLEIEITETVLMEDSGRSAEILEELKKMGVQIAIDDFGTGYSSLQYLHSFPFDRIKIDRTFIQNIGSCNDSLPIVRAIANLVNSLGISVTAEGIETRKQLESAHAEGCHEAQGFLFSRPVVADQIDQLLVVNRLQLESTKCQFDQNPFQPGKGTHSQ